MKVSVVLPVFNGARTISRAVRSILDQTLRDIELIVVDDGSTDATRSMIGEIQDSRLRVIETDHGGVVRAANIGSQQAKAALIARMDADDFSHPDRLRKQVWLLEEKQLDVVGCRVRILDANHQVAPSMQRYERWINEETLTSERINALRFVELPLVNPTILARREYFELQFSDNGFPEDYDLMLRAASTGMRFGKVDEVLFDWIDCPNGLTRTHPRYSDDAFMACRRHHLHAGPLRDVEAVDLWGFGKTGKSWQRWLVGQGITVRRGYDVAERKVGKIINGTLVQHTASLENVDGTPLIIAVGAATGRADILPQIEAKSYHVGRDAWFVA